MRYCVARSGLHEGNDRKERFLTDFRQRFNALQVVQVPRAVLFTNLKTERLWKRIISFRLTKKDVV